MEHPDGSHAGQAAYTPRILSIYDLLVLGVSNRLIWRCPTRGILALYDRHVTDDHLDVGVGTGWFLDRCRFPSPKPRIGLLDLNENSLTAAAHRIARYRPQRFRADVLKPVDLAAPPSRRSRSAICSTACRGRFPRRPSPSTICSPCFARTASCSARRCCRGA